VASANKLVAGLESSIPIRACNKRGLYEHNLADSGFAQDPPGLPFLHLHLRALPSLNFGCFARDVAGGGAYDEG
jgi:hypothetical protein